MERLSLNPFRELTLLAHLIRLYRREAPDVVHHFTIKCVVYGSLAARLTGVKRRINAVAGMGYVFTSNAIRARILRPLVRWLMKVALDGDQSRLILQNSDDCAAFEKAKLVASGRLRLIRSSGVNTQRFRPRTHIPADHTSFRVILAARLLWEKGIREYVDAAQQLKAAGLGIDFLLAGSADLGNPSAVPAASLREWNDAGLIKLLGHVEDMAYWLHRVDIAVLPSYYREGVPKSLLEAAACGLPAITTDAPGCRDIVEHEVSGLLIPCRDATALARAIQRLYDRPDERVRLGAAAREKVLQTFDERIVLARTMDVYDELSPGALGRPINGRELAQ
jgi:glycosyltransferase involved in cell wall biosynthesis